MCLIFQSSLPSQGATCCNLIKHITHTDFNPRSPHRERPRSTAIRPAPEQFQSTLPSQGATLNSFDHVISTRYFNPRSPHRERHLYILRISDLGVISIHAPLTGSDAGTVASYKVTGTFQSTLPSQGATLSADWVTYACTISIHAPLTGSDVSILLNSSIAEDFNPRSPHRERHFGDLHNCDNVDFNPRSPHRERQL